MTSLAERIKTRLDDLDMNQTDLSKKTGFAHSTISKICNGAVTNIKLETLYMLADALKCSPHWLSTGEESNDSIHSSTSTLYPVLTLEQAARHNEVTKEELEKAEKLPCPIDCSKGTFIIHMQGSSMEPHIQDGELIFIDPKRIPSHNSFVLVKRANQNTPIIRMLTMEDDKAYLKATNPIKSEQFIELNENDTIIGKAVISFQYM